MRVILFSEIIIKTLFHMVHLNQLRFIRTVIMFPWLTQPTSTSKIILCKLTIGNIPVAPPEFFPNPFPSCYFSFSYSSPVGSCSFHFTTTFDCIYLTCRKYQRHVSLLQVKHVVVDYIYIFYTHFLISLLYKLTSLYLHK